MDVAACPFDHPMEWDRAHYRAYGMKYRAGEECPFEDYAEWRFYALKGHRFTAREAERIIKAFTRAVLAEVREKGAF